MKRHLLRFWLQRFRTTPRHRNAGFTLIELLIVTIVGSLIMLALLALINELLLTDRNESVRLETNREMQIALDYMAEEVREASYIYTGHCLAAQNEGAPNEALSCNGADVRAIGNPGSGILPEAIASADDIPVLAFWKQHPLPEALRNQCRNNPLLQIDAIPVPCTIGSSYALVVYALSTENPGDIWRGGARIKRYMLTEFNAAGTARTPGYANPTLNNNNFDEWPYAPGVSVGGGNANAPVLVDFVDGTVDSDPSCPDGYSISPHPAALAAAGNVDNDLRSFYACISPPEAGRHQEAVIYLQGNIDGRVAGAFAPQDGALTVLQTRVMARGVFEAD
ncbi:prepilin-type N-terminal cleavage/methylation domain-containing protein [Vacuolonema iberomarrocanum]|uniref:prepilin-type N-terminal cleavage/methylation domain-containing protein n=1 Tax=Vacuolonema iberomarrocanum TaxID=3454632 RepID=UPI0019EACA9C|nr:prepilin-type N-terminal cleavage/methylation domain-containing protein [filamentous cyanobacterium LEGE 07170]